MNDIWVSCEQMLPNQLLHWQAVKHVKFKVKLADGRVIKSYYEDGQWNIEKINPKLKVTEWVRPVLIG